MEDKNIVIAKEADTHLQAFIRRRFEELDKKPKASTAPNLPHLDGLDLELPGKPKAADGPTNPPMIGLHINPPEGKGWDKLPVSKKELLKLNQVLASARAKKYMEDCANDPEDKSAVKINGAIQLFLSVGDAKSAAAYLGLKKHYPKRDKALFIQPGDLLGHVHHQVISHDTSLEKWKPGNHSIVIGTGSPQPHHCDVQQPPAGQLPEKFGVCVLSANSHGTIVYNMEGVPDNVTVKDLEKHWGDKVSRLLKILGANPEAVGLLSGCGRLFFATKERRVERGVVEQFSVSVLDGAHPHCAPESKGHRAVLFFTLQPPPNEDDNEADNNNLYNGDTQVSRQKLVFLLYEQLLGSGHEHDEDLTFLANKFMEYVIESATLYGSVDHTFQFPQALENKMDAVYDAAAETHKVHQEQANSQKDCDKAHEAWKQADQDFQEQQDAIRCEPTNSWEELVEAFQAFQQTGQVYQQKLLRHNKKAPEWQKKNASLNKITHSLGRSAMYALLDMDWGDIAEAAGHRKQKAD